MEEPLTRIEFARFLLRLNSQYLTVIEIKFLIWHYFNNVPYSKLAELEDKSWSRQYSQQIVKEAINKLRQV